MTRWTGGNYRISEGSLKRRKLTRGLTKEKEIENALALIFQPHHHHHRHCRRLCGCVGRMEEEGGCDWNDTAGPENFWDLALTVPYFSRSLVGNKNLLRFEGFSPFFSSHVPHTSLSPPFLTPSPSLSPPHLVSLSPAWRASPRRLIRRCRRHLGLRFRVSSRVASLVCGAFALFILGYKLAWPAIRAHPPWFRRQCGKKSLRSGLRLGHLSVCWSLWFCMSRSRVQV